jgi:hypothetical protein
VKRILISIVLFACALTAQAQGTLQLYATLTGANEVPPNSDPTVTTGTLSLSGNLLSFRLDVPLITFIARNAYIQGPAGPGANAPIIFDLGGPVFQGGSPEFGIPPSYVFFSPYTPPFGAGPFTLNDSQINDLLGGLWYMNVTSSDFPNGQLRGQILPVPEPSAWILTISGGLVFWMFRRTSLARPPMK